MGRLGEQCAPEVFGTRKMERAGSQERWREAHEHTCARTRMEWWWWSAVWKRERERPGKLSLCFDRSTYRGREAVAGA